MVATGTDLDDFILPIGLLAMALVHVREAHHGGHFGPFAEWHAFLR